MRDYARLLIEDGHGIGRFHGLVGIQYENPDHAIVLSGGGIDSFMSTVATLRNFSNIEYLTFLCINYGQQTADAELYMTQKQAEYFSSHFDITTKVVEVHDGLMTFIRNPLGDRDAEKEANSDNYAQNDDYVPNRNARFVFTAAGLAETIKAQLIIIGAVGNVNMDNSLAFLEAAYETIKFSNRDVIPQLYAPFVMFSKSMVALYAQEIKSFSTFQLESLTTSCFDSKQPTGSAILQCGVCRSCASLKQAFKFAGVHDPYIYASDETTAKSMFKAVSKLENDIKMAKGKVTR